MRSLRHRTTRRIIFDDLVRLRLPDVTDLELDHSVKDLLAGVNIDHIALEKLSGLATVATHRIRRDRAI